MITIRLNQQALPVEDGTTLAELVARLDLAPETLATAVNGDFVARDARGERRLRDGDQVTTFQPITGG
jgi:sulfur carrier protein